MNIDARKWGKKEIHNQLVKEKEIDALFFWGDGREKR